MDRNDFIYQAIQLALENVDDGGGPFGAVVVKDGHVVATGTNRVTPTLDPTAHAETVCIRNAGRRRDWHELTLVSTLSPCIMCTGTSLLFRIPRVVIGESENFLGAEGLFAQRGVELIRLHDPRCIAMMRKFIAERPELWNEDIGM